MSVMRSRREPPTLSVPALRSGGRSQAIECMSSWVWSSLSCCHRGIWPGVGVLSEYGRRLHPLVGGVGGVGMLGLVVSGSVDGDSLGESGVGGSESVVAWSVVGLGGCLVLDWRWVWSSRRARW